MLPSAITRPQFGCILSSKFSFSLKISIGCIRTCPNYLVCAFQSVNSPILSFQVKNIRLLYGNTTLTVCIISILVRIGSKSILSVMDWNITKKNNAYFLPKPKAVHTFIAKALMIYVYILT